MAQISLEINVKYRFWVKPLLYCASFFYAARGRDTYPDRFIDWVVKYGIKIELSE